MPTLRLLSVDARPYGSDLKGLAAALAAAEVDVACVHGAPHLLRWRSRCAELGRRAGLVTVTGGRYAGGSLLLSTLGVDVAAVRDVRVGTQAGINPPGAALAVLRRSGAQFVLGAATLAGNEAVQVSQVGSLRAALAGLDPAGAPVLLSVEGPTRPGSAAWEALADERVAVGGRLFLDGRAVVTRCTDRDGAVVVDLTL